MTDEPTAVTDYIPYFIFTVCYSQVSKWFSNSCISRNVFSSFPLWYFLLSIQCLMSCMCL